MKSTFYHEAETKTALVDFITQADMLSMGEQCKIFEQGFAKKQERQSAIFVGSGSAANLVLLQALLNLGRLKPGDQVGFSALTWATNVMPIIQLGLRPVALDCELETLNVSPTTLTSAGQLEAIFLTNVLGLCDDLPGIAEYCEKNNIILLEDNCESLGSKIAGRLLGNFGLASTFSFFVGHHMSTIEGGMICTDDQELAEIMTMVRAHGWDRNLPTGRQKAWRSKYNVEDFFAKYTFYDLAYNARPTEINGFIGNTQLPYWDEIVSRRAKNFARFQTAAAANPAILPLKTDHMDLVSNFAMPVVYTSSEAFLAGQNNFKAIGAEIRPVIAGDMTAQPFYKKYVLAAQPCPNSALVHKQGLYFGNNPELTEVELTSLESALEKVLQP